MKTKSLLLLGLLAAINAQAATRTWTAGGSANWSDPDNWSPSGPPQPGDDLVFPFRSCQAPDTTCVVHNNDLNNLVVGRITFTGYHTINGNAITVTNGIEAHQSVGTCFDNSPIVINCGLVLPGGEVEFLALPDNTLRINGPIHLNGTMLRLQTTTGIRDCIAVDFVRGHIRLMGVISGTGNIVREVGNNGEEVEIGGPQPNTFTGTVRNKGNGYRNPLYLNKENGDAINSVLIVGRDAQVELKRDGQLDLGCAVIIEERGRLLFDGHDSSFAILEMRGGLLDTGGGVFGLLYSLLVRATNETAQINGVMNTTGPIRPFEVHGPMTPAFDLNANLFGLAGFEKLGTGTMRLRGTNTFSGEVIVTAGIVEANSQTAFGATAGPTTLAGGGVTLRDVAIPAEPLFANGPGAALLAFGTCAWAGPISLNDRLTVYGENLTLSGVISGTNNLSLLGGTISLSGGGANTFTGATEVGCELLRLNKPSNTRALSGPLVVGGGFAPLHEVRWLSNFQLPAGANVTVRNNALLSLNDFTDIVNNLTFSGGHVNLATDSALQVTGTVTANPTNSTGLIDGATGLGSFFLSGTRTFNVGDGSVAGPDLQITARIAGGGITKIGEGTLALGGNNAFGGAVVISNGIVRVDHDNGLGTAGAGTTVRNGATLFLANAADLVREPVTLNGTGLGGTNGALLASGAVVLSNNVVLASPSTIRVESPWQLKIDGVISGTGPLTKIGSGALTFAGTANNTFTGDMLVNAGTLQLDKSDFLQSVPGNLVIGSGGFFPTPATVRHFSQDQIWSSVTVNSGSLLDLNGYEEYLVTLTLNGGGDVQTGAGLLTVDAGNSITVNPGIGSATSTISGRLGLRAGNHNFNVGAFLLPLGTAPELDIPAQVVLYNGIANIHKNGSGGMRLGGSNTFSGVLYADGGRVIAANNSALGTTQGSTVVQTNGSLVLDGGITTGDFLILDSAAFPSLISINGTNVSTNGVNLIRPNNGLEVQPATGVLQVRGRVSSVGGLTKLGPGTLQFFGLVANDYAGLTVISNGVIEASRGNVLLGQGFASIPGDFIVGDDATATTTATLRLYQAGQVTPNADATLHRSGLLDLVPRIPLPNTSARLRTVTGAGKLILGTNTSLTISNDTSFTFSGAISGGGALNKRGGDTTMHMTGDSPFSGPTTIIEGYYQMDGSASNSPVTIKAGAALNGDGTLGDVTVEAGGLVFPVSDVPGRYGGDLAMRSVNVFSGGQLGLNLWGARPTGTNESLIVNGPVTLSSAELVSARFLYAPREGDVVTLIHKLSAGPVSGSFNGYPQAAPRTLGGIPVVMSYTGGDGNDVTLTVTNLALAFASWRVESGNGNGLIEPDECNLLYVALRNRRGSSLPLSSATLRSLTPYAVVTMAQADYPAFTANSLRTNPATLPTPHPALASLRHACRARIANQCRG